MSTLPMLGPSRGGQSSPAHASRGTIEGGPLEPCAQATALPTVASTALFAASRSAVAASSAGVAVPVVLMKLASRSSGGAVKRAWKVSAPPAHTPSLAGSPCSLPASTHGLHGSSPSRVRIHTPIGSSLSAHCRPMRSKRLGAWMGSET